MSEGKKFSKNVWKVMMFISVVFIIWTVFVMSRGNEILPTAFRLADSPQTTGAIEKKALDFMNMTMLKPLWEGIWAGILGIYIALKLKMHKKFAWTLGIFWGIMFLSNAAIQGGYELLILGWPKVCLQTYMFLFLGLIVLASLVVSRRSFFME